MNALGSMRSGMAGIVGLALFGSIVQTPTPVRAGDDEWATAGKILAGVVGFEILRRHVIAPTPARRHHEYDRHAGPKAPPHHRYTGRDSHHPPAVCPPPVVTPHAGRVWRDGHYIYIPRREWVDTSYEVEEWVPGHRRPDGVWVDGHRIRRTVSQGYWRSYDEKVWVPAGYN